VQPSKVPFGREAKVTTLPQKKLIRTFTISLTHAAHATQGYLDLKAYREFDNANRPNGWNAWVTFVLSAGTIGAIFNRPAHSIDVVIDGREQQYVRLGSKPVVFSSSTRFPLRPQNPTSAR